MPPPFLFTHCSRYFAVAFGLLLLFSKTLGVFWCGYFCRSSSSFWCFGFGPLPSSWNFLAAYGSLDHPRSWVVRLWPLLSCPSTDSRPLMAWPVACSLIFPINGLSDRRMSGSLYVECSDELGCLGCDEEELALALDGRMRWRLVLSAFLLFKISNRVYIFCLFVCGKWLVGTHLTCVCSVSGLANCVLAWPNSVQRVHCAQSNLRVDSCTQPTWRARFPFELHCSSQIRHLNLSILLWCCRVSV